MDKIKKLRAKAKAIDDKINDLQDKCPHPDSAIVTERKVVGYDGYGNNYSTTHSCRECDEFWFIDGYSVFGNNIRKMKKNVSHED